MNEIQLFTADTLPAHFLWQLRDFTRIVWDADFLANKDLPLHPERWHPTYLILAEGEWLISATAVLWKMLHFDNISYKIYGLGIVMTYPARRKQGYGRKVVSAATTLIRQKGDADVALLQTAPHLENFYAEHGWEHTPEIKLLTGNPDKPSDDDGWYMMMFLSEGAKQVRPQLEANPVYFDEVIW